MELKTVLSQELASLKYVESSEIEPLFYAKDMFKDEGEKIKYIKKVEKVIRSSVEYTDLIQYLRKDLSLNSCSVLTKLNSSAVGIELHHAPFTLFDITEAVINERLNAGLVFSTLNLAEEVIILHYEGIVGLTPLSKTIHELVHSDQYTINPGDILGNVEEFKKRYEKGLSESAVEKYIKYKEYDVDSMVSHDHLVFDADKRVELNNKISLYNKVLKGDINSLEDGGTNDDTYNE